MKELLTPGGEHHGIVDGEGLMMMTTTNSTLWSTERAPDQPSDKDRWWWQLRSIKHDDSFSLIFPHEMVLTELDLGLLEAPGPHKPESMPLSLWLLGGPLK